MSIHSLKISPMIVLSATILVGLSAPSLFAQDLSAGRLLAAQCAQCHGTDGNSKSDIDSLAGSDEILEEMLEMQAENEADDIMVKHAHGYTREQIELIAAYFATQTPMPEDDDDDKDEDKDEDDDKDKDEKDDD